MPNETVSDQINAARSQQAKLVTQPNLRRNNKAKEEFIDSVFCFFVFFFPQGQAL